MPEANLSAMRSESLEATVGRLKSCLLRLLPGPGKMATAVDNFFLIRRDEVRQADACCCRPSISVILQGRKEAGLGSDVFTYGEYDCVVVGVAVPSCGRVLAASAGTPLLAVSLTVDETLATELAATIPPGSQALGAHSLGMSVARVCPHVLGAFARLVGVLDRPEQVALMGPLLVREIVYRVLMGPQGGTLRMIYTHGSYGNQVAEAIAWLRAYYGAPLQIDALAARVGMATSTFHRQFKKTTSLSPLQFQKYLRLYEAQRLMLAEGLDAGNAGRRVGYDSIQQFCREYKRMFGEPPGRDVRRLRRE